MKRRKTSKSCCTFKGSKPQPLFSLILEFKTQIEVSAALIQEQSELVMEHIKKLKKRLFTDICVYNHGFDDPFLPLLLILLMDCFEPVERSSKRVRLESKAIVDTVRELQYDLKNQQLSKNQTPSATSILFMKVNLHTLRRLEATVTSLNRSFDNMIEDIAEIEEGLIDNLTDVHNIRSAEEVSWHEALEDTSDNEDSASG